MAVSGETGASGSPVRTLAAMANPTAPEGRTRSDATRSTWASGGASHMISRCETKPLTSARSIGPSPTTLYAMLTSPLRA